MSEGVTEQRGTLLAIAAMLLVANSLALFVMNVKVAPPPVMFWAGFDEMPPEPPPPDTEPRSAVVRLHNNGVYVDGERARITALVSNMGRDAFLAQREACEGDHYCPRSPWTADVLVAQDASIATVIDAQRRVRSLCNVEIVFHLEDGSSPPAMILGFPFMLTTADDPQLDDFSNWANRIPMGGDDATLMGWDGLESLDHFGERTGCARISPLRP